MPSAKGDHGHLTVKSVRETGDRIQFFAPRGLLDDLTPIVGMIPGLEGIIKLVPELLDGTLGPALNGLIISSNKEAHSTSKLLKNQPTYMLATTTKNPSTIWLVDERELNLAST